MALLTLVTAVFFCGGFIVTRGMQNVAVLRNLVWCVCALIMFLLVRKVPVSAAIVFLLCLCFAYMFSLRTAVNPGEVYYIAAIILTMALFLPAATAVCKVHLDTVIKSMTILAFCLGVYGIYQYFTIPAQADRIGTAYNMNICASSHIMLIPFCGYALRYKVWRYVAAVGIAMALFVVLFSLRTRSAYLALVVMTIAACAHNKKLFVIGMVCIVYVCVCLFLFKSNVLNTSSLNQRFGLWKQSLEMTIDNPMGVGGGNWKIVAPLYRAGTQVYDENPNRWEQIIKPHNDFVSVMSEAGFAGLAAYLGFFAVAFYVAVKAGCVIAYTGLSSYMVLSFFSWPMTRAFLPMVMLIYVAIALRGAKMADKRLFIVPIAGFAIFIFSNKLNTEIKSWNIVRANHFQDYHKVIDETENISRFANLTYTGTPLKAYRGMANIQLGNERQALIDLSDAVCHNPTNVLALINYAVSLHLNDMTRKSCDVYQKTLCIYPDFPIAAHKYQETYFSQEQ